MARDRSRTTVFRSRLTRQGASMTFSSTVMCGNRVEPLQHRADIAALRRRLGLVTTSVQEPGSGSSRSPGDDPTVATPGPARMAPELGALHAEVRHPRCTGQSV